MNKPGETCNNKQSEKEYAVSNKKRPDKPKWFKYMRPFVLVLASLIFAEIALQILSMVSPNIRELLTQTGKYAPRGIKNYCIGARPNPAFREHDCFGFRNAFLPSKADIVALGDSQTYGTSVLPHEPWPQQLAEKTDQTVYNMGFGGWGPAHSLILHNIAFSFTPRIVIEGLYSGNDLTDSLHLVYGLKQSLELLKSDESLLKCLLDSDVVTIDENGRHQVSGKPYQITKPTNSKIVRKIKDHHLAAKKETNFFIKNSTICGLGRAWMKEFKENQRAYPRLYKWFSSFTEKMAGTEADNDWFAVVEAAAKYETERELFISENVKTMFTPRYRLVALDLGEPHVVEGLRLTLNALRVTKSAMTSRGIRYIVMFIPTKELVFANLVYSNNLPLSDDYKKLVDMEKLFWSLAKQYCSLHNIETIDVLPTLREPFLYGKNPYFKSHNGHPNAIGQNAIAGYVAKYLENTKRNYNFGSPGFKIMCR